MKLIKTTLCSLLLILVGCSSKVEEQKEDKRWKNYLKNKTINKVKNPYMVSDIIYRYSAEDSWTKADDTPKNLCFYKIYTLNDEAKNKQDLLAYLQGINSEIQDEQETTSVWMPLSDIKPEYFNPFNEDTFRFDRFKECQEFLAVNKPAYQTEFVKKNHLKTNERFPIDEKKATEMKAIFSQVVTNPNTLVRLQLWCTANYVYFYDDKREFFLKLTFIVPTRSKNPACQ